MLGVLVMASGGGENPGGQSETYSLECRRATTSRRGLYSMWRLPV